MREVAAVLHGTEACIHGLRMMNEAGNWHFLSSVDSTNIGRNFKDREEMPGRMADRIDRINAPPAPDLREVFGDLFDAA